MDGGFIAPIVVYVITELFNQLRNAMCLDGLVPAAFDSNSRWPKIASIATYANQSFPVQPQERGGPQLPSCPLIDCIHNHTTGKIELKKPVASLRLRASLRIMD